MSRSIETVIVTGADKAYFYGLQNLVGSIHFWIPGTRVLIFNLGLRRSQQEDIAGWRDCELHWAGDGPPTSLAVEGVIRRCRHMRRPRSYAWKAVAMVQAMERHPHILWLDAGGDLRGEISVVSDILAREGCFLVKGQDLDMTSKLHPRCVTRLGFQVEDFAGKPSYAGSAQGYARGSSATREILLPMYRASCDKACIAPFGSSTRNHRFDQSLLSLFAYSCPSPPPDYTEYLTCDRGELSPDPTEPSYRFLYTARRSSAEYVPYLKRK